MKKNILIITGEPSGDMRAGELIRELKEFLPDISFWGIGGDRMRAQNVELIEHIQHFSLVGAWEVVKNLSRIRRHYKNLIRNIRKRKPDLAILIDYPGFNLRVARFLHSEKIPVIYYIIPQVWAWGRHRLKSLKRFVDKALVLFKFEEHFLKQAGIDCEFVGHPLLDNITSSGGPAARSGAFTIALLPGSRKNEILGIFPVMLEAAEKIHGQRKDVQFVVAENSNVDKSLYDSALAGHGGLTVSRFTNDTFTCLDRCDFAMVTSGTATLETAIMEKPMVIVYRAAFLTYVLFRLFMRIPFIGLANIIAGEEVAPELLQGNCTSEKLYRKVLEITGDDSRMRSMKSKLREVKRSLGERGASRKAAETISRFIEEKIPAK